MSMSRITLAASVAALVSAVEPNPPTWNDNVKVINPGDKNAQSIVDAIYKENGGHTPDFHGQWSESRYAIMFTKGYHKVDVNVGFYTTIHGLGRTPQSTTLEELRADNGSFNYSLGALQNFWRSAENVKTNQDSIWSVSQAAPIRRVHIGGNLDLTQKNKDQPIPGYSSGGFMADVIVDGTLTAGGQQQFALRNTQFNEFVGYAWNYVHVGNTIALEDHCNDGKTNNHVVEKTPIIAEKPYIIESEGKWTLMRPRVETDKVGNTPLWDNSDEIDFSDVYVASDQDTVATINAKLEQGLHLVLQPGNYNLTDTIQVNNANTVVLGLGMATLISTTGKPCIQVAGVDGVRVAGILLQAGFVKSPSLIQFGVEGYAGNSANPGVLSDVFARVGGMNPAGGPDVLADYMMVIDNGNTIIDDTWLWRADHDVSGEVKNGRNPVETGLVVNGDYVHGYGLASEHTTGDLLHWNGNHGKSYFYQAEFPYDVTAAYGHAGYTGYRVNSQVTTHDAYGIGCYSYFRDNKYVEIENSITVPKVAGVNVHAGFSVFLAGNGLIKNVINQTGDAVWGGGMVKYVCNYNGSTGGTSSE